MERAKFARVDKLVAALSCPLCFEVRVSVCARERESKREAARLLHLENKGFFTSLTGSPG